MDTKLATSIDKWCKGTYTDNTTFQRELEPLYKSLVEAAQDAPKAFLSKNDVHVDRCVRWHLLKLAINKGQVGAETETGTSSVHLQLAKTIMTCEKEGWELLFYSRTGKRMKQWCKREPEGGRSEQPKLKQPTKQTGKVLDASENKNPHLYIRRAGETEKTLFATALYEGHPFMKELLAEAKRLYRRTYPEEDEQQTNKTFARIVRGNNKDLHDDIVNNHRAAGRVFGHVLREIPGVLQDPDIVVDKDEKMQKKERVMLDRIIEDPLPQLASVILASDDHRELLTTRKRIVKALENCVTKRRQQSQSAPLLGNHHKQDENPKNDKSKDNFDDDDDDDDEDDNDKDNDDGGDDEDDENSVEALAVDVLSHAPKNTIKMPEVLTMVMKHRLFDNPDILQAYAKVAKDAQDTKSPAHHNSSTPPTPSESLQLVASFLKDVPGILHMAVLFQQQPLAETLLRHEPLLAVARADVQTTANDATPGRRESEPSSEMVTAAVDGANAANGSNSASGHYPLWYNNYAQDKNTVTWRAIRSALIYCTMKHAENVQTLLTILRESGEPENEINFDMSRLLIEGTSVADFVTSMPRQGRSYSLIRYEETIRYAEFPVLDLSTQPRTHAAQTLQRSHLERTHREILDMLEWLSDHGVRRIITLRVPDRMAHPHDELDIASVVKRFCVEELDWRILDLSLNIFQPHSGPEDIPFVWGVDNDKIDKNDKTSKVDKAQDDKNKMSKNNKNNKRSNDKSMQKTYLTRLHLYTGGRRAALDHWFSTEGLESTKLKHVHIHVIKELTTKKQSDATVKYINTKIGELKKRTPSMEVDVQSQFWTAQTETPRLQEIIHDLSPRLAQFIAVYRDRASNCYNHKRFQPVKVAIIDNGILSIDPPNTPRVSDNDHAEDVLNVQSRSSNNNSDDDSSARHLNSLDFLTPDSLWARVCDGKSFVHEQDRVSPWYFASNPHGTQMANLVCAIDPLCQLFVAKIADGHYGYSAARAAEAVEWAMVKGVDIISMSFTTTENFRPFKRAVQRAMESGILVVCSHHDEGARISTEVYPASFGGADVDNTMLRMASCNMYGKLQHDWDDNTTDEAKKKINQYDFCINSQDVAVGAIPFLATSPEHISGSSVATAIAAGVCSLLIACLRTLHKMPLAESKQSGSQRYRNGIEQMKKRLGEVLSPSQPSGQDKNNRPSYADIKTYLDTMAPSSTNPRFISLDRFAHLDELRDVNTQSVLGAFFNLGDKFPAGK